MLQPDRAAAADGHSVRQAPDIRGPAAAVSNVVLAVVAPHVRAHHERAFRWARRTLLLIAAVNAVVWALFNALMAYAITATTSAVLQALAAAAIVATTAVFAAVSYLLAVAYTTHLPRTIAIVMVAGVVQAALSLGTLDAVGVVWSLAELVLLEYIRRAFNDYNAMAAADGQDPAKP
jgi:hypothetical protein